MSKPVVLRQAADDDIRAAIQWYDASAGEESVDVWRVLHAHRDIPSSLINDQEA